MGTGEMQLFWSEGGGLPTLACTQLPPPDSQRADEGASRAPAPNIFVLFVDAPLLLATDMLQQLLEGDGLGPGDVDGAVIFGGHQWHQDELIQGVGLSVLLGQEPAVPAQRVQLEGPPEVLGEALPGQVLLQLRHLHHLHLWEEKEGRE